MNMEKFSNFSIIEDKTDGLLEIYLAQRHGDKRSYYIRNNLDGRFYKGDLYIIRKILQIISNQIPKTKVNETVLGFSEGGIVISSQLSFLRKSTFSCSTKSQRSEFKNIIKFSEEHRSLEPSHYIYSLNKGDNVLIIEDEISSASSMINACTALKKSGITILGIATVIEITNFNARERLKKEIGIDLVSACKIKLIH